MRVRCSTGLAAAAALVAAAAPAAAKVDPAKLDEIRTLVAEAVAIEQAQAGGRVTGAYADGLRHDLKKKLSGLIGDPAVGPIAARAQACWLGGDVAGLAALRDRLVALERRQGRR
jgi:hypothetical protein